MPLIRRVPKRGFTNIFRREYEVVNLRDLGGFDDGAVVGEAELVAARLVRSARLHPGGGDEAPALVRPRGFRIKILGAGELERRLTVRAHAFSAAARRKIEAAGGSAEHIGNTAGTAA